MYCRSISSNLCLPDRRVAWGRSLLAVGLCVFLIPSFAEGVRYSLHFSRTGDRFDWDHKLSGLSYSFPVAEAEGDSASAWATVSGSSSFSSSFTRASASSRTGDRWRDNASGYWSLSYPFARKIRVDLNANMNRSSDNLFGQKIATQSLSSRIRYTPFSIGPFRSLSVSHSTGQSFDRRMNRKDSGRNHTFSLGVRPELVEGMSTSFSYSKSGNTLKRKDLNANMRLGFGYRFSETMSTTLNYSEGRRDRNYWRRLSTGGDHSILERQFTRNRNVNGSFQFSGGENLQFNGGGSRAENLTEDTASNDLLFSVGLDFQRDLEEDALSESFRQEFENYGISLSDDVTIATEAKGSLWQISDEARTYIVERKGGVLNIYLSAEDAKRANPKRGTDRRSTSIGANARVSAKVLDRVDLSWRLQYGATSVRYLENDAKFRRDDLDKHGEDLAMNSSATVKLGEGHSTTISGHLERISNDHAGSRELDRDELKSNLRISYTGEWGNGLRFNGSVRTDQNHLVNLDGRRSGGNRWTRNYQLDASTSYEFLKGVRFSHSYGLSANYKEYDYDELLNPDRPKSDVRRAWSMNHSISGSVSPRLRIHGGYSYKTDDEGSLFRTGGTEQQLVSEDELSHSINFGMSYSPSRWLSISPGYRYRRREVWDHVYVDEIEDRQLSTWTKYETMSLSVNYNPGEANTLTFSGSRTSRRRLKGKPRTDEFITLSYLHVF